MLNQQKIRAEMLPEGPCPQPPLGSNTTYNMGVPSIQSVQTGSAASTAAKTHTQNKDMYHF